jgi:hypothetical protein
MTLYRRQRRAANRSQLLSFTERRSEILLKRRRTSVRIEQ